MRTGAAGVLVGGGRSDLGMDVPLATAIADARAARVHHLDETGVYCHIIAMGPASGVDAAKAIAIGADAVMVDGDVSGYPDALRSTMAFCGYTDVKSFQKAEVVVR
jgi:IMP dehydrogenase